MATKLQVEAAFIRFAYAIAERIGAGTTKELTALLDSDVFFNSIQEHQDVTPVFMSECEDNDRPSSRMYRSQMLDDWFIKNGHDKVGAIALVNIGSTWFLGIVFPTIFETTPTWVLETNISSQFYHDLTVDEWPVSQINRVNTNLRSLSRPTNGKRVG